MKKKSKKKNKLTNILEKIKNSKVATLLNDPKPIIVVLMIICVLFIIAFSNYKSKYKVYDGSVETDSISIRAVHVYIHPKMNVFFSSGATYTGEEKKVYQYQIGYYYKVGDTYHPIKESYDYSLATPVDLKDIISKTSYFNYSEFNSGKNTKSNIFTNNAVKNIKDLHFIVSASTTESTEDEFDIQIDSPINFTEF